MLKVGDKKLIGSVKEIREGLREELF